MRFCLKTKKQKLDRVGNVSTENVFTPIGTLHSHLLSWDVDPIVEHMTLHSPFHSMGSLPRSIYFTSVAQCEVKAAKEAFKRQE